jgi:hypothetical protein
MFELIDQPGAFHPPKRWREFLERMRARPNRNEERVQDAIADARRGLARAEAVEGRARSTYRWRGNKKGMARC